MSCYLAENATVKGTVSIGENAGIWYHATIRADSDLVSIGKETNVQDGAVIHVTKGYPVTIGEGVTIGHGAIVHGCTVGDNTLIGMGAILLNGARIGKNCIIGAGALITQNMKIPDGCLAFGNPAKIQRSLTKEEIDGNCANAGRYVEAARKQLMASEGSPRHYNCIVVFDRERDRLLFCKRKKEPYQGLYNFVGGKVEPGEDGTDAAYRELFEETGIERSDILLHRLMDLTYYEQNFVLEIYVGRLHEKVELVEEVNQLVWLEQTEDFADTARFAGEKNIAHIVNMALKYSMEKK